MGNRRSLLSERNRKFGWWKAERRPLKSDSPCSVEGCKRPYYARGLCSMHWQRKYVYGYDDPSENRRTPIGEPLRFLEEEVLTYIGDECLLWPYSKNGGYGQIGYHGRVVEVHRLVCEIKSGPPPPNHVAAHSCGNGDLGCITPNHLGWSTRSQNARHKYRKRLAFNFSRNVRP